MYKAILFAPDGSWVTDYPRNTIEEVQEALADQGSRWYFYPFCGVIAGYARTYTRMIVLDMAEPFGHLSRKSIKTVSRAIRETPNEVLEALCQ